jgi:hypothetical protein
MIIKLIFSIRTIDAQKIAIAAICVSEFFNLLFGLQKARKQRDMISSIRD